MANRQARRAARKAAARFIPNTTSQPRRTRPGLLPRTRDFHEWLAFINQVYGGTTK